MIHTDYVELETRGHGHILDVTDDVAQAVRDAGLQSGMVTVFTPSATSSLTCIEYESGCVADLNRLLDEIIPPERDYRHNQRWGDGNGHAHVRAALLGPSLAVPVVDGRLTLGTWQQIVFCDFDNRPRQRRLVVQMVGE